MNVIEVVNLTKKFGGLAAVNSVNLKVNQGEILSIIGPNGAGKSTLFKLITGFLKPTTGRITFMDEDITNMAPHLIARQGVVRTFQETTIFKEMSALENVAIAHHQRSRANSLGIYFNSRRARQDEEEFRRSGEEILEYLGLGEVKYEEARNLPHGYLRELGIAIAMATKPKVLLLDEPFSGMNPEETDHAITMVEGIRNRGITVMLVEHDMRAVMRISERIIVLSFGEKIAEGTPAEIQRNEAVIEAYLGREDDQIGV